MGIKQYNMENENKNILNTNNYRNNNEIENNGNSNNNNENDLNQQILKEIQKDNTFFRIDKLIFVILPFIIMLIITLLYESFDLIEKCSVIYWIIYILYIIFTIGINYYSFLHIMHEYNYRISINFPYDEKDIIWNFNKCLKLGLIGLLSGFIAGTIGIGGGVVLGPILLSTGIYPVVSTVTTNFLVLLTSSSTSIQFICSKMMNIQYAIISVVFSMLGSFVGTKIIHHYFKESGRQSLLIFALVLVIGASAIVLPVSSFISTMEDVKRGTDVFKFNNPCDR